MPICFYYTLHAGLTGSHPQNIQPAVAFTSYFAKAEKLRVTRLMQSKLKGIFPAAIFISGIHPVVEILLYRDGMVYINF